MQTEMTNLLSRGNTAEIFDYSENKILKLFNKDYPELAINHEFENSKIIFNLGIKTPKAYEITDCSERKGIVYDKIEGTTVLQILLKLMKTAETDKSVISEINSYFEKFARFHKNFISKTTDNPNLMNYKDFLRIFARDKKDFLEKIDALPDGNNVLHGDFHPDNLMLGKGNSCVPACRWPRCSCRHRRSRYRYEHRRQYKWLPWSPWRYSCDPEQSRWWRCKQSRSGAWYKWPQNSCGR